MIEKIGKYYFIGIIFLLLTSCATWYQRNADLMRAVSQENYVDAEKVLSAKNWDKPFRNRMLAYLNKAWVLSVSGKFKESNDWFQKADFMIEDYHKSIGEELAGAISNPTLTTYTGEYYEQILLHYYTTLNYLQMGLPDEALIECKRMMSKMQRITDDVKSEHKYRRDAFAHLLMGIVYDALNDNNNAFISYKKAIEIYQNDFQVKPPKQLIADYQRTGLACGLIENSEISSTSIPEKKKEMLVFWNNGMCPIKDETGINFSITSVGNNRIQFYNYDFGFRFEFPISSKEEKDNLNALRFVRIAIPRFVSRKPQFSQAKIIDGAKQEYTFEEVENIEKIAFHCLDDRMLKELGEAVLRLATKQAAEQALRSKNQGAGIALDIFNALTEQADTRNWQLLPSQIYYTRIPINSDSCQFNCNFYSNNVWQASQKIDIKIKDNLTYFMVLNTPNVQSGFYSKNGEKLYD